VLPLVFISFCTRFRYHLDLHSFPTRRSSDLATDKPNFRKVHTDPIPTLGGLAIFCSFLIGLLILQPASKYHLSIICGATVILVRSEEHTSELQSRFDLVCRLLLEKKKT